MSKARQLLRVQKIFQEGPEVRGYRMSSAIPGVPLADFHPGQYINFFYRIGATTTTRPYSIASSPDEAEEGFYDIYIHGGGEFTASWVFSNVEEGSLIEASIPTGDFYYDSFRDTAQVIGISGGMSITPLISMARAVAEGSLDIDLTLFCGWDTPVDCLFHAHLKSLAEATSNLRYVCLVADGVMEGAESGYINLEMIRRHAVPEDATFFVCGPQDMYDTLDRELAPLQVMMEHYHQELPGEIKSPAGFADYAGNPENLWELTVESLEKTCRIPAREGETLLVAMERAGLSPEARCRSGHCIYCRAKLTSGEVFVPARWDGSTEEEKARGLIHPCCSFPLSDIRLEFSGD